MSVESELEEKEEKQNILHSTGLRRIRGSVVLQRTYSKNIFHQGGLARLALKYTL
jgi:hypothetical protein